MPRNLMKYCISITLILTVWVSSGCVWYRDGGHSITIVNHTDRPISDGSIQFGSLAFWAGAANAQNEGGNVSMYVHWVPRKAIFTWNWGDVIGDEDNVQTIPISPYPDLPSGAEVGMNYLRIHVFPDNRIEAELAVTYFIGQEHYIASLYEGPKKLGWWLHQD